MADLGKKQATLGHELMSNSELRSSRVSLTIR